MRFPGTASNDNPGNSPPDVTVAGLGDRFSEALAPLAGYLWKHDATDFDNFRRIIGYTADSGLIQLNRAHSPNLATSAVSAYLILTPPDWNEAISDALEQLYFVDRVEITPVSGQSLYAMPAGAEWIQVPNQITRLLFRRVSNNWTTEEDVGSYKKQQDANAVSLLIESMPITVDALTIIVEARHTYDRLTADTDTTTCPRRLAKAAVRVEALKQIWTVMGEEQAKVMFGQEMREAEYELLAAKKQFVPQAEPSPLHVDQGLQGPELAVSPSSWRW